MQNTIKLSDGQEIRFDQRYQRKFKPEVKAWAAMTEAEQNAAWEKGNQVVAERRAAEEARAKNRVNLVMQFRAPTKPAGRYMSNGRTH